MMITLWLIHCDRDIEFVCSGTLLWGSVTGVLSSYGYWTLFFHLIDIVVTLLLLLWFEYMSLTQYWKWYGYGIEFMLIAMMLITIMLFNQKKCDGYLLKDWCLWMLIILTLRFLDIVVKGIAIYRLWLLRMFTCDLFKGWGTHKRREEKKNNRILKFGFFKFWINVLQLVDE